MIIAIDVNNVLYGCDKYRRAVRRSYGQAVDSLLRDAAGYRDWTGRCVMLFFDGAHRDLDPLIIHGLQVCFSGPDRSADADIERFVQQSVSRSDIIVVTSDRGVREQVCAMGSLCVSPETFAGMLKGPC